MRLPSPGIAGHEHDQQSGEALQAAEREGLTQPEDQVTYAAHAGVPLKAVLAEARLGLTDAGEKEPTT